MPRRLAMFLAGVGAVTIDGFAASGLALGLSTEDPGDADYVGPQRYLGTVQSRPYPLLRLHPGQGQAEPRILMLSGGGKHGVQAMTQEMDGRWSKPPVCS